MMIFCSRFFKLVSPLLKVDTKNIQVERVRTYIARRALMYVPGSSKKMLDKAFTLNVDCIVMDCEDGVALNKKDEARATIRTTLDNGKPVKNRPYDLGVRINSFQSGLCEKDLEQILAGKFLPDTVLLPKVDTPEQIKQFSDQINKLVKESQKINLIILIESALAFINLLDICKTAAELSEKSKFMLCSLVFGSDDFCASIGASRTESSTEILYARQKMVLVAKAFNLQAIDMVYIKYKDLEGLQRQCLEGANMGYTGKQIIHPGQIDIVQKSFLPSQDQIKWAKGLIEAFNNHQTTGKGAFIYEGSMIDMPTMKQAQNIVQLANLS